MNGELVPWHDAKVHVLSHALHYGSGVFEGIRAYETARGPAVWHLDAHLDRMYSSASIYFMEIPYSKAELVDAVEGDDPRERARSRATSVRSRSADTARWA